MEGTATLADTLLDDLDDLSDLDESPDKGEDLDDESKPSAESKGDEGTFGDDMDVERGGSKANVLSAFLDSPSLKGHIEAIRKKKQSSTDKKEKEYSTSQNDYDYDLVVQSNRHLAAISEELARAHGSLATAYKPKFPELEELLPNFVQYKNAVRIIWNEMDLTRVNDDLAGILNSNQIITVSVAGSTTSGRPLTAAELEQVEIHATSIERLLEVQKELVQFVESSMESLAPSICALIGPSVAAKLLGLAGGLAELTKIPACNLQVIGQTKHNSASRAGMSNASTIQHAGLLTECELIQNHCPKHLHKKALKAVAAKLALACRFDFVNVDTGRPRSSETGRKFRQELQEKFDKWQEPDKAQVLKALPKPDLTVKKRRGGKRMRRWKERFEETAMMKQANTRAFSAQAGEYGDDAMGVTLGLLDTADSGGAVRKTTEKRKMRQANTKASRKRATQMAQQAKNKDGLASSVVFSQTSSMELVNPDANRDRVREANRKWFSDNAGFQSALPKK